MKSVQVQVGTGFRDARAIRKRERIMESGKSILVVEDERDIADALCYQLRREGYQCRLAADGEAALAEVRRSRPDLIILDRMLPKLSGDEVAARLKRASSSAAIPIIMLTAKAEDADELVGFALGADDYVRKPFSIKLLLARIAAMLRREHAARQPPDVLSGGPAVLDRGRHEVRIEGQSVALTATEFKILATLMGAGGRVLSRGQLIDAVLGPHVAVTDRTMDVHIAALRRKLGPGAQWIQTVRGVGYTYRTPADAAAQG